MKNFISILGVYRGRYILVTACTAVMMSSEAILHPILMKAIFDAVSQRENFRNFLYIASTYLVFGLTINALNYAISLWQVKLDNRIVAHVSTHLLRAYFSKNYSEILRDGSGYYVARIRSDVKDGLVPMLSTTRKAVVSATTFVSLIGALIFISFRAFLVLSAIIPLSAIISVVVSRKIRQLTNLERESEASLLNVLTSTVNAFKIVVSFGLVNNAVDRFSESLNDAIGSSYRKAQIVRRLQGINDITMVISDVCSIFVGAVLVFYWRMTLGSFIAFMNAFWRSATALIAIFSQWAELHGYSAVIDRLTSFMSEQLAVPNYRIGDEVSAKGISYAYAAEQVLSDVSIDLKLGERVLIVGKNGTGKTTLANILSGHLPPSAGQLVLPARISSVTLPIQFPPAQVRELPVDLDLLARLGCEERALLDTEPALLSAGQQQKVALALALSRDADLYVLDEPLANLDDPSRKAAMREIQARTRGCMLIMIMHNADEYVSVFDRVHRLGSETAPSTQGSFVTDLAEPGAAGAAEAKARPSRSNRTPIPRAAGAI